MAGWVAIWEAWLGVRMQQLSRSACTMALSNCSTWKLGIAERDRSYQALMDKLTA